MQHLRLLGAMALTRDGADVPLPASRKTRALLAYLAVTNRAHSRDRLCAMFWPIPDDPRAALRRWKQVSGSAHRQRTGRTLWQPRSAEWPTARRSITPS